MGEHTPTPGPWTISTAGWQPWEGAIQILGPEGQIIAFTSAGTNEKADAPLLAAAPDLVKALEAMRGYLLNAKIDLETGCTKATAIKTIEGGIKQALEALAKVSG